MRSLIRGHRRSDSSTSDLSSPIEQNLVKLPPKTNASPIVPCLPLHMTPPQAFSGSNQSAMSSPKKLLTPIKKIFGHHGKNGNLSATVDNLNSVVFGEFEPPKGRKPIGANSLTNLSELRNGPYPSHSPKIHGYRSLSLLEAPSLIKFEQLVNIQPPVLGNNTDSFSDSSQDQKKSSEKRFAAIFDTRLEPETNESLLLELVISKSRTSTESEQIVSKPHIIVNTKNDSETLYEADDDLRDSDASSQFSFVKDMVGGRNTSIKYYKTKSQMKKAQPRKDFLGIDDIALDDEAVHSDYDFENNGLDDDCDFEDDGFEANDRFNDFLSDESLHKLDPEVNDLDLKPPKFSLNCNSRSNSSQFDESDTDILKGSPNNSLMNPMTGLRSPGYGEDFLDAYLDKSRLPLPITSHSLALSLRADSQDKNEQKDPIISDIDVKLTSLNQESSQPSRAFQNRAPSYAESRKSITDMMGILAALDLQSAAEKKGSNASVSNIMGMLERLEMRSGSNSTDDASKTDAFLKVKETLSTLEQTAAATSPEIKAQMRRSIADMMNTLSILDDHLEKKTESKKYQKQMSKKPFTTSKKLQKRYSWCNDSEKVGYDENSSEILNGSLDQDLLDEINMVPEDFDFDKQTELETSLESGFYRSNSYNKKPERVIKDFKYQDNKIKTPLKTVTFYRGNSEHSLNVAPSRMGSNKSMTSFSSVDDADFDRQFEAARSHISPKHGYYNLHNVHVSSPLYCMSSDSISRRSENLEPIDESDVASI